MAKIDPEDADYVCSLTPESLEKAKRELFEDPQQRLGAVQTLRKWIKDQPHITSRTDTYFLLAVLRTAKFSQLRAREIIENILTTKAKVPKMMTNLNTLDPFVHAYLDSGVMVQFPKVDKEGRAVRLMRYGWLDCDNKLLSPENDWKMVLMLDALLKERNENVVVNGEILITDMTGITAKHVARGTTSTNKDTMRIFQECMLGRFKGIHLYNPGMFIEVVMQIMRPFMKKKFLDRISFHHTMESLYEVIPMDLWPDEYLPDDYTGPSAGSIASINANVKQRLVDPAFNAKLLEYTSDKYKIDLSKKPTETVQASFRKLNVD